MKTDRAQTSHGKFIQMNVVLFAHFESRDFDDDEDEKNT